MRARVKPLRGTERIDAGAMTAPFDYEVTMHHRADVKAQGYRLDWGGVKMNIRSVANMDEKDVFLTLFCEADVPT